MGNVNTDGIWTPDEEDTLEPDVWSQQMAESISQGLGARMKLQETRAGVATQVGASFTITGAGSTSDTGVVLQVKKTGSRTYVDNMTLAGGVVTVKQAGLYFITLAATAGTAAGVPLDLTLYIGTSGDVFQPFTTDADSFTNGSIATALMLDEGDTIYGRLRVGAGRSDTVTIQNASLRATLLYAVA